MVSYSLTDLGNKSGEVVEAAFRGPVSITKRGKRKFILMTADQYDRLLSVQKQKAFRSDGLSPEERAFFLSGLEEVAEEMDRSDD